MIVRPEQARSAMAEIKIFTIDEAERALPLVKRVLTDLKAEYATWRDAVAAYELLSTRGPAGQPDPEGLGESRAAVTLAAERINGYLQELEAIGCLFKGFEEGFVDFYALKDDRPVFLCWKLGEEHITHWHEVDAGFSGRRPIEGGAFSGIVP
jgi:hypothetical protein